jgi:hypothetical protein
MLSACVLFQLEGCCMSVSMLVFLGKGGARKYFNDFEVTPRKLCLSALHAKGLTGNHKNSITVEQPVSTTQSGTYCL